MGCKRPVLCSPRTDAVPESAMRKVLLIFSELTDGDVDRVIATLESLLT